MYMLLRYYKILTNSFSILFYRFVYVWDTLHGNLMYKLPGHQGSVNDVDFHPKEPICKNYSKHSRAVMHLHVHIHVHVLQLHVHVLYMYVTKCFDDVIVCKY